MPAVTEFFRHKTQQVGPYTFAHLDRPDDVWRWCICKDYRGPQEYGDIVCSFNDVPTMEIVRAILETLDKGVWAA